MAYNSAYTGAEIDAAIGAVREKEDKWDSKTDLVDGKVPAEQLPNISVSAEEVEVSAETAALLGLTSADPTVDDALKAVVPPVGEIMLSKRTDLGDKWLLCNGDFIPEEYGALRDPIPGSAEYMSVPLPESYTNSGGSTYVMYNG